MSQRADHLNTWIELDGRAFRHNLQAFRNILAPGTQIAAVIKANAYGHGMAPIARLCVEEGVTVLAVHSIQEAEALREDGIDVRIVLLGPCARAGFADVVRFGLEPVLSTVESLRQLETAAAAVNGRCSLHIKLETGTNRQGLDAVGLGSFLRILACSSNLSIAGVCTHFANIEDTIDQEYAFRQLERFHELAAMIEREGFEVPLKHTTCTAATLLLKESRLDMVRVGIGLYGLWPSRETYISHALASRSKDAFQLRPVLTWKARISEIKSVAPDSYIGYGCTYRTTRDSRIAIVPVGYSEGYGRRLSNNSHVLVSGIRAPVRGRVCMNLMMIDVTDIAGAAEGDEVVLIGRSGDEAVTADDLAALEKTINNEVIARINPAIPRILT